MNENVREDALEMAVDVGEFIEEMLEQYGPDALRYMQEILAARLKEILEGDE